MRDTEDVFETFSRVTRVEVIDQDGRTFTARYEPGALVALQDNGRTLKVFAGAKENQR